MSIQILPDETVNQIAAGEVVERPAHLVKELVENSLDAGSTDVEIEIDHGGREVRILDNGQGIARDDLKLAISRHATSKISQFDDLYRLNTYGFRGEALASIAAVSRLLLSSATTDNAQGFRIAADFGAIQAVESIGHGRGTSIQIKDLFANVPARLKFLKTDSAEVSQIKTVLRAMALSAPQTSFRIRSQGRLLEFWPAVDSRVERAQQLLGVEKLYPVIGNGDVRCEIAFSAPSVVGKSSRNIWLFVQNRWVQDRAIQAAVMDAYRSLLMHGEFPYVAVWLELDPQDVDVNVHPTKSQVKFRDPSKIFRVVHHTLRKELEKAPWAPQVKSFSNGTILSAELIKYESSVYESAPRELFESPNPAQPLRFEEESLQRRQTRVLDLPSFSEIESLKDKNKNLLSNDRAESSTSGFWSRLEVLGQAHMTYILAQSDEGLIIVDQHAAHERVNFEKLLKGFHDGKFDRQAYLLPLTVDLEPHFIEALLSQCEPLIKMGVELEQTGPDSLVVVSRPAFIEDSGVQQALIKLAHEVVERGGSFAFEKVISDIVATMACHSSVRAGQALSVEQMRELLKSMDQFPLSTFCPHGRPVHLNFSFHKLERDFGRIV